MNINLSMPSPCAKNFSRCNLPQHVKVYVEMTSPELTNTSPHSGRVPRTVYSLKDSSNRSTCQLVLVTVLSDEVTNVFTNGLLLVTGLVFILRQVNTSVSKVHDTHTRNSSRHTDLQQDIYRVCRGL